MARCIGWLGVLLVAMVGSARGAVLEVDVGTHHIAAGSGQVVELYVAGGAAVMGFDLVVQVGDGQSGPRITGVDLVSGIFLNNNTGQGAAPSTDWTAFYSITTQDGLVSASGLLARLTIDATDVAAGSYPLVLAGIEMPGFGVIDSTFLDVSAAPVETQFTPGVLEVTVPEPTISVLFGGVVGLVMMRRRGR